MLSKKQITYVKGYLFKRIADSLDLSVKEVDREIKNRLGIKSISKLDNDGYMEVCVYCFKLGDELGLDLNFKDNDWNKIYDKEV
jgi:hypothetical protein